MPYHTVAEAPGVIDLVYLESSSFGRADFVLQAIDVLLDQLPEQVSDLNAAFSKGDLGLVRVSAHKIKSAAGLLGMTSALELLRRIENDGERVSACSEQLENWIHEVNRMCELAMSELKAERYRYT